MADKEKKEAKVITTESITGAKAPKDNGLVEVTLIKDHGNDKKGDTLLRPSDTAQMLINKKIAK